MVNEKLRRAVGATVAVERSATTDRELLRRFADAGDQPAFAALVRRHTPLVLGVCRRALPPADAEDACQAVFLVLARKAGGRWQPSVANWLYVTARKVCRDARRTADRRDRRERQAAVPEAVPPTDRITGTELLAALDEELDRLPAAYREPLVLCYLEGLSREEAAGRLGVPAATVKTRLERGRKRLAAALAARGITAGLGLLAVAVTSPAGASPPRLIESVLAAVNGSPSPTAAALAQGVTMTTVLTKGKLVAVVGALAVGVGLMAVSPSPADPPKQDKMEKPKADAKPEAKPAEGKGRTITGTVVGPDGKPVEGATIKTMTPGNARGAKEAVQEFGKTGPDGTFRVTLDPVPPGDPDQRQVVASKAGFGPDWVTPFLAGDGPVSLTLATDDVPVKGRVTDLQGKPVPKATVRVTRLSAARSGDLSKVWEAWPQSPYQALRQAGKELWHPTLGGLPESVTADADGQFEIKGVGRGRLLGLVVSGTGIETAALRVVTDPGFDPKKVGQPDMAQPGPALYAPAFTHAGKPSQPVVGTVTDGTTGKPVAGVRVVGTVDGPHWGENSGHATTDADGKFTLHGVAKADTLSLFVSAGEKQPYLSFTTTVSGRPGLTEILADLKMPRGVRVKGKVVEAGSGKPVAGAALSYTPLADNKCYPDLMQGKREAGGIRADTGADGRFEVVVLPGAGVITAQGETRGRNAGTDFTQVRVAKADRPRADTSQLDNLGETFSAANGHIITLDGLSGYAIIDPKPTDDTAEVTITFDRGGTATGKVVDADGKPAVGVTGYGLTACYDRPKRLKDGAFTAIALEADHPRAVLFADPDKKLAAAVELKGGEKDLTVKLRPWGKLSGRLLAADGQPVAGATVSARPKNQITHSAFAAVARDRTAVTDKDGKFTLEVPGGPAEYLLEFGRKNQYLDTGVRPDTKGHTVKPGETTDVGDVKVKGE